MNAPLIRISAIFLLGLLAPFWWSYAASNLIFGIFHIAGNPERPPASFAWASILVPNIALGLLTGYVLSRLSVSSPFKGLCIFWAALFGGALISALVTGDSIASLPQAFISPGNFSFLLATVTLPLIMTLREPHG